VARAAEARAAGARAAEATAAAARAAEAMVAASLVEVATEAGAKAVETDVVVRGVGA
jgi:hypothetical protein